MSTSRAVLLVGTVVLSFAIAACTAQPASTVLALASASAPASAPANPTAAASPSAPAGTMSPPYPIWTMVTSGDLPAGFITQMARDVLVEDAHGGGHVDLLPARFFVDYTVSGTCRFGVKIYSTAEGVSGPSAWLSVLVDGESTSNRWTVTLAPGPYEISPSATDGCMYLVTVNTIPAPPG